MVEALVRFEMFALLTGTKLLARSAGLLSPCNYGGGGLFTIRRANVHVSSRLRTAFYSTDSC